MTSNKSPAASTIAAKANHYLDLHTGGITPPIQTSTTFARDDRYELIDAAHGYARDDSPSFVPAERTLAELENGEHCLLFSSGMAAIATIFHTLTAGSQVVMPASSYWGAFSWARTYCERKDIAITYYDNSDLDALAQATRKHETRLVWVETPSNPFLHITDIAAAADIAHEAGAMLCVDSTTATPVFTQPLTLGADLVMHSATKFLNGHSDVLAGALVVRDEHELWKNIAAERRGSGAVPGTFESWLLMRGMRTLFVRVHQATRSAQRIAEHFQHHAKIEGVLYPGLPDHPGHDVAAKQMHGGYGALLSLLVKGNANTARKVAGALELIISATSLGGVESLIEHRHSVEPPETGVPENLLRLSVGIEAVEDLIADLEHGLATI